MQGTYRTLNKYIHEITPTVVRFVEMSRQTVCRVVLLNKYWLGAYQVPGTKLGDRDQWSTRQVSLFKAFVF